ncbi:MAG TPA: hypothetical protein VMF13_08915 [Luteitalea sp.]|nr:hypothetical protein [Luteitalea sp.]
MPLTKLTNDGVVLAEWRGASVARHGGTQFSRRIGRATLPLSPADLADLQTVSLFIASRSDEVTVRVAPTRCG